jgi:hypothetical protein
MRTWVDKVVTIPSRKESNRHAHYTKKHEKIIDTAALHESRNDTYLHDQSLNSHETGRGRVHFSTLPAVHQVVRSACLPIKGICRPMQRGCTRVPNKGAIEPNGNGDIRLEASRTRVIQCREHNALHATNHTRTTRHSNNSLKLKTSKSYS